MSAIPSLRGAFKTTDGQRAQSTRDRASQEVNLSEFTGYDPSGSGATNHTALASAWAAMIARGRSRVVVPPGAYRFAAAPTLEKTFVQGTRCELVGSGQNVTQFIGPASATNIFNIGNLSGDETGNIGFRDFAVAPGAVHTGYAFAIEKSRNIVFENVNLHLPANGWGFGPTTVSSGDKTTEIKIINCDGQLQSNPGGAWLHFKGGEFVTVLGGRTTGRADQSFILHDGPLNSDGVYVFGHTSELWGYPIRSVGPGIVNCRIDVHQFDRALHFIYVEGPSGSINRNWQVRGQFLGESASATSAEAAMHFDATDGVIERITIFGSMIDGRQGPAGRFIGASGQDRGPYVLFNGNYITDCGSGGTPLFVADKDASPSFLGNKGHVSLSGGASGYTYAIDWGSGTGHGTGRRKAEGNLWLDYAIDEETGTR